MSNPIIYSGTPGSVSGSTPFGFYDNDPYFQIDAPKVANYVATKLGYPVLDVELSGSQIYACLEEAVSIYAEEVYHAKIKANYLSLEGTNTGSLLNNQLIVPSLSPIITIAENYGSPIGIGGLQTWYTGTLTLSASIQEYDMQQWAISLQLISSSDRVVIQRIFYENLPAINQYYDPYFGLGGLGGVPAASSGFGFGGVSGVNYQLYPVSFDIQRIQQIEMSNEVRRSAYSFELINNKLKIFPIPQYTGIGLQIQYSKQSEINSVSGNSPYGTATNIITNPSNVPYGLMTYNQINQPGKQWIYEYTLALASELLGLIRGKYQSVPIPGSEFTLNGSDLITKGKEMQTTLREKLRQDLEDMSHQSQLQRKQSESDSMSSTLNNVPLFVYVG